MAAPDLMVSLSEMNFDAKLAFNAFKMLNFTFVPQFTFLILTVEE